MAASGSGGKFKTDYHPLKILANVGYMENDQELRQKILDLIALLDKEYTVDSLFTIQDIIVEIELKLQNKLIELGKEQKSSAKKSQKRDIFDKKSQDASTHYTPPLASTIRFMIPIYKALLTAKNIRNELLGLLQPTPFPSSALSEHEQKSKRILEKKLQVVEFDSDWEKRIQIKHNEVIETFLSRTPVEQTVDDSIYKIIIDKILFLSSLSSKSYDDRLDKELVEKVKQLGVELFRRFQEEPIRPNNRNFYYLMCQTYLSDANNDLSRIMFDLRNFYVEGGRDWGATRTKLVERLENHINENQITHPSKVVKLTRHFQRE